MSESALPEKFRKLDLKGRQEALRRGYAAHAEEWAAVCPGGGLDEVADIMVESAVGSLPLPLGIARGFLIDGESVDIPMATEEPSVIAAATYAAKILRQGGGLSTWAQESWMTAQIFLENPVADAEQRLLGEQERIASLVDEALAGMKARGGGFRALEIRRLAESGVLMAGVKIDVRDAMGANALNTAAESVRSEVEKLCGGRAVMSILSNAARDRRAGARFSLPLTRLAALGTGDLNAAEVARRIVLASAIALEDEQRAITHNKGIMNGIIALVLATMNDTRAVEAGAHSWAARSGRYQPLSCYRLSQEGDALEGEVELPLALGSLGGAVGFHPASRLCLRVLGTPDARRLCRIAAALGLAQNFAAVLALVTGGIQRGHMRYHAARLAYQAGARGEQVRRVAEELAEGGLYNRRQAAAVFQRLKGAAAGDRQ